METLISNGVNIIQFYNYTDERNSGGESRLLIVVKSCGFIGQQEINFSRNDIIVFRQSLTKLINNSGSSAALKSSHCAEFAIEIKAIHVNVFIVFGQLSTFEPAETTVFNHSLRFSFELQFTDLARVNLPLFGNS